MELNDQQKLKLYNMGHYVFTVPPVITAQWSDKDWITYIGDNWTECKEQNCDCHKILSTK